MDPRLFLISLFVTFLTGVGVGTFLVASLINRTLAHAKAEFITLRQDAEAKITEAENVIRRAPGAALAAIEKVL